MPEKRGAGGFANLVLVVWRVGDGLMSGVLDCGGGKMAVAVRMVSL